MLNSQVNCFVTAEVKVFLALADVKNFFNKEIDWVKLCSSVWALMQFPLKFNRNNEI